MKTIIEVQNNKITLTAKLLNEGVNFPNSKQDQKFNYHNEFLVTVSANGKKASFKFYDSFANYQKGKTELSERDLQQAFYSFTSDTGAGKETFENFCAEFGYNEDSRTAEKIHKACQKSREKFNKLFPNADYYDFINELQEKHNLG